LFPTLNQNSANNIAPTINMQVGTQPSIGLMNNQLSNPVLLALGMNTIAITVAYTSTSVSYSNVYTLSVTLLDPNAVALSELNVMLPAGTQALLSPSFNPNVTAYSLSVPPSIQTLTLVTCAVNTANSMFIGFTSSQAQQMTGTSMSIAIGTNPVSLSVYVLSPTGVVQQTTLAVARTTGIGMSIPIDITSGDSTPSSSPSSSFVSTPYFIVVLVAIGVSLGILLSVMVFKYRQMKLSSEANLVRLASPQSGENAVQL